MIPQPDIRVQVDPSNPGQFFACCGLLELAGRLSAGSEGWFDRGCFCLTSTVTLQSIFQAMVEEPPEQITLLDDTLEAKPLIAPLRLTLDKARGTKLQLDAWMTIGFDKGSVACVANPPWNFWSGQQTSLGIWNSLRSVLRVQISDGIADGDDIFFQLVPLSGRFGFDPGSAWNALDAGFSPNEQGIEVASSPAVEMLAAVGIQRFRPRPTKDRDAFIYATWGLPLLPSVAAAAACSAILVPPVIRFLGRAVSRGSYGALGHSTLLEGEEHE